MRVYAASHNPCFHESDYSLISLHMTEQGAQKAITRHKKAYYKNKPMQPWERYRVDIYEVQP